MGSVRYTELELFKLKNVSMVEVDAIKGNSFRNKSFVNHQWLVLMSNHLANIIFCTIKKKIANVIKKYKIIEYFITLSPFQIQSKLVGDIITDRSDHIIINALIRSERFF